MLKFHRSEFDWGEFVEPKINIPDVLARETKKTNGKKILFSSVTDCYQPVEAEFGITRRCLEILAESECSVSILTKSSIAQRDADLVSKFRSFTFGMSVSYHLDETRVCFERDTATITERLATLRKMKDAGAKTWLFVSPFLPGITDINSLLELFSGCVDSFSVEAINLYASIKNGLSESYRRIGKRFDAYKVIACDPCYWMQVKTDAILSGEKFGLKLDSFYFHGNS